MEGLGIFFAALVIAFIIEAVLEYVFGIWWKPVPEQLRPRVLMAVGLVFGIALCICYKLDLVAYIGQQFGIAELKPTIIGQILTGALVGRGSEFLHSFWKKLKL